jgi:DNA polymerase-3 subunit gamma/tau
MPYQSLYLRYRPQTFEQVIGQDHVCQTFRNALAQGKTAHAYLFCGPRGTGKTTTARILAKALCCTRSDGPTPDPCGECDACVGIRDGTLLDVVELDAASNRGIDEVRNLREIIGYQPTWARSKVFIIDEVHQMTREAFNALLKTLEEPPDHAFFILATTDPQKVPVTILSRCQRFDFHRVPLMEIAALLRRISDAEHFNADKAALAAIARLADGCVRDAITTLDQVVAYTGGNVSVAAVNEIVGAPGLDLLFDLSDIVARGAAADVFPYVERLAMEGKSYTQVLEALVVHFRNLLVSRLGAATEQALEADRATVGRYAEESQRIETERLATAARRLGRTLDDMRWNGQHRVLTEMALVEIAGGCGTEPVAAVAPARPDAAQPPAKTPRPRRAKAPEAAAPAEPEPSPPPPAPEEDPAAPDAPPPEPAPAPPPPRAPESPWERVVDTVANARPALAATLRGSIATEAEGKVTVAFKSRFQLDGFEECLAGESGRLIRDAVASEYGPNAEVTGELTEGPAPKRGRRKTPGGTASPVEMVLGIFEGSEPIEESTDPE